MAGKRRGTGRKKWVRKDWVYRPQINDEDVAGTSPASYDRQFYLTAAGHASAFPLVLYDSKNFMEVFVENTASGLSADLSSEARAEGRRARIYATEWDISILPYAWSVGQGLSLGFRLGSFEQSPAGNLSIDASYSMFDDVSPHETPARWANTAGWVRETRMRSVWSDGATSFDIKHYRGRWHSAKGRSLAPDHMWCFYVEQETGSPAVVLRCFARTLVGDEG